MFGVKIRRFEVRESIHEVLKLWTCMSAILDFCDLDQFYVKTFGLLKFYFRYNRKQNLNKTKVKEGRGW